MRVFRSLLHQLWREEIGVILSAEAALLGTVAVIGASVGLSAVSKSMNDELTEVASAFRSLDQSYHIDGQRGCGAWTAGSSYEQPCVEESREELREYVEELEEHQHHSDGRHHEGDDSDEGHEHESDDHADHDHEEADVDDDADDDSDDDDRPRRRRDREEDDSDDEDDDSDDDRDDGPGFRDREDDDRDSDDEDELSLEFDSAADEFAEPTRVRPAAGE